MPLAELIAAVAIAVTNLVVWGGVAVLLMAERRRNR